MNVQKLSFLASDAQNEEVQSFEHDERLVAARSPLLTLEHRSFLQGVSDQILVDLEEIFRRQARSDGEAFSSEYNVVVEMLCECREGTVVATGRAEVIIEGLGVNMY